MGVAVQCLQTRCHWQTFSGCYLNLLLDVEVAGSAGLFYAQLSQLDVNGALVIQLLLVLLCQVAAIVWELLFVLLNFCLPALLVICMPAGVTWATRSAAACMLPSDGCQLTLYAAV